MTEFTLRHPTPADLQTVYDLLIACDLDYLGYPDTDLQDLINEWKDFPLDTNAWIMTTPQQVVGYEIIDPAGEGDFYADGYVHPKFKNQGIGSRLLQTAEARARDLMPASGPSQIRCYTVANRPDDDALFLGNGFYVKTYTYRMRIDLNEAPPAPIWPDGVTVRQLRLDDDEREAKTAWRLIEDAFAAPDRAERPYEAWRADVIERDGFEQWMFNVAVNPADEIVGVAHLRHYPGDHGWLWQLAVRQDYRQRGLGMALLHYVFGLFWDMGERVVKLGVDTQNPTGALRLYERASMSPEAQFVEYRKTLREG